VEDVMEDLTEQMDDVDQIGEAMGQPLGGAGLEDDDDLLDELDALGEEEEFGELDEGIGAGAGPVGAVAANPAPQYDAKFDMPEAHGGIIMPNAPEGKVEMTEDEAALAALEAEMAM
jgi:hypothetical protein